MEFTTNIQGKKALINVQRLYEVFGGELKYVRAVRKREPIRWKGITYSTNSRIENCEKVFYYIFSKIDTFIAQDSEVATIELVKDDYVELKLWECFFKMTREEAEVGLDILL